MSIWILKRWQDLLSGIPTKVVHAAKVKSNSLMLHSLIPIKASSPKPFWSPLQTLYCSSEGNFTRPHCSSDANLGKELGAPVPSLTNTPPEAETDVSFGISAGKDDCFQSKSSLLSGSQRKAEQNFGAAFCSVQFTENLVPAQLWAMCRPPAFPPPHMSFPWLRALTREPWSFKLVNLRDQV